MVEHTSVGENGIDLYYRDVGEGPAVTFLHGFGGNHLTWWQQIPTFAEDYRCVVPDQRRFGLSVDTAGLGVGAFVDDLVELLDALGIDRTALVGHSMSGWTVASFATQYPERVSALVLSATPGGLLSADRHHALMEEAADSIPEVDPLSREEAFLSDSIKALNRDAPPSWEETRPVLEELPVDRDRLVEAGIPTLLVAGEADGFMPASAVDELADHLDAETTVVEGAGHSAHFDRPDAFNRSVKAFLDERATF